MRCIQTSRRCELVLVAAAVALISLSSANAFAQGGKNGGSTSKTHRLVTLELVQGGATAMTQAVTANGATTVGVVGWLGDFAQFWRVSASNTVASIPLALPPSVDPQSPLASAEAINNDGLIVGGCRLIDTGPGQPLLWEDELAHPVQLPLPAGFSGLAIPRAINNGGVILGELSGDLSAGGGTAHVEGLIAWLTWRDQYGQIQISTPTWFAFNAMSQPVLNDQGWVAFKTNDGGAVRLRLVHHWVWDAALEADVSEFYFSGGEEPMFGGGIVAGVGGINQAGHVAGDIQTVNQPGRDVYVKRLDGTFLNMPIYINDRTYGTYVHGVDAVNDATAQHGVQVLGEVGTYNKKYNTLGAWYWATWESGGSVRLLKDIAEIPTDSTYDFTSVTSFHAMNDASWICGRIARGVSRVGVPAVLIRKP